MSVSSTIRIAGPYSGNGATVTFPFAFKVFQPSEVVVVQTDINGVEVVLTITTDYTVTLNADQDGNPGGVITMLTAPAVGYLITLGSNVDALQDLTLTNQGGFYPKVINDALDRITIVAQQILNKLGGVLKVGVTDGSIGNLPSKGMRSDMGLGFDANGDPIAVPLSNLVNAIPTQEKGAALGVATLDVNSKLVQMPTSDDIDPAIQTHITSPHAPSAAQQNRAQSTTAQAQAGTDTTTDMSPARVKEAIVTLTLGDGQTWQNMTASRAKNVTYTNTTGRSIGVMVRVVSAVSLSQTLYVDGAIVVYSTLKGGTNWGLQLPMVVIPNGSTYKYTTPSGTITWMELR